ncbi:MAG TPA: Crp/Fnr family transcriptional regulator [Candidatus Saccharimonadales bacterium]|nr:Crp/Fnr family transcriptional regulator [Candidatus Saccharimonadales bacterium]
MPTAITRKITRFISQYESHSYRKGEVLLFGGEPIADLLYLQAGQVRQYDISYRGDEVVVNALKNDVFFPLAAVMARLPNRYFFEAVTEVQVCHVPLPDVQIFLQENHDVLLHLFQQVCAEAAGSYERLAHMMGGTAPSRVLYELLTQARMFGEKQGTVIFIAMSESELAARSGLSRETVSREVHKLKKTGLLDVSRKGLTIKDRKQLEQKLGSQL